MSVVKTIQGFQSTLPSQGATLGLSNLSMMILHFNPRSPHRERLCTVGSMRNLLRFQSTLPSQGATAYAQQYFKTLGFQSTLPSQGATASGMTRGQSTGISIHAPLTGSDKRIYDAYKLYRNFNPRSPHRERLCVRLALIDLQSISIHAPLTGSDRLEITQCQCLLYFNPRSPHRERPYTALYHP